jgi:ADP-ribosylglycohydrolase
MESKLLGAAEQIPELARQLAIFDSYGSSFIRFLKGTIGLVARVSDEHLETAVARPGNGSAVTAPDTVPFALWCAARHLGSYEAALWSTVSGRGDRDTTCAIVGGIVVMYAGVESIPVEWLEHREQIPSWVSSF